MPDAKDVANLNILRLALGGGYATEALSDLASHFKKTLGRALPSTAMDASLKMANLPPLQDWAERIVWLYTARLCAGGPVDDRMRELIMVWCDRRLRGKARGRPAATEANAVRDMAVQWEVIEQSIRRPKDQRKVVIPDVAKKFNLKPRQVYKIIKHLPVVEILAGKW
jgi:hypothetical protein